MASTVTISTITSSTGADPLASSSTTSSTAVGSSSDCFGCSLSSSSSQAPGGTVIPDSPRDSALSAGAKAGIGVGIGLAVLVLVVILTLFRKRQQRKSHVREIPRENNNKDEKSTIVPREGSAKDRVLPTWKSELSGESHRAELDAENTLDGEASKDEPAPTELDAAGFASSERVEVGAGETQEHSMPARQREELVDSAKPPPIPYASKPKPN